MHAEIRLLKQMIALIGRYWVVLPICCLLLFPVHCDASPFPHSVFVSPTGEEHAGHSHGNASSDFAAMIIDHAHHHDVEEAGPCRIDANGSDPDGADVQSMSRVGGSIDSVQAASVPNLNHLLSLLCASSVENEGIVAVLIGETPHPPAPPPRA